jgi:hypothetical protein
MILGLYYFLKSITCRTIGSAPPSYILASIMFALSALSQFLFVNIYISMVGVYVLFELIILIQMKNFFHLGALYDAGKNILFGIFPSFILLLIFCSYPAMKLTRGNEGFWGGNNGFWRDTVGTLIVRTLNESFINSDIILFSKAVIIATLFLAFLIIICDMIRNRALSPTDKYCICMLLLILISSLGIVTQHYLLNIPYPFDRYALYLIPTFFLIILLFLPNIKFIGNQFIRTSVDIVTRFLIVCLLLMFIGQTSFTHFIQWKYDASTKNVMDDIIAMNRNKTLPDDSVSLGINWLFEPSTNYYILKNNISWIRKTDRSGPVGKFDYYYVTPEYKNFLDKNNIKIIRQYETTGNYLAVSNPR